MGGLVTWQELVVAVIVGAAVVSLYRHLRSLLAGAEPSGQSSCHGCDSCEDDPAAAVVPPGAAPGSPR
jgi:hypothetical protein